jgi:hypothetical protein
MHRQPQDGPNHEDRRLLPARQLDLPRRTTDHEDNKELVHPIDVARRGTSVNSPAIPGEMAIPASPGGKERRRSPRFGCEAFAEATTLDPDSLIRGTILNINENGCHFQTMARIRLKLSTEVHLRFKVENSQYSLRARVVNIAPGKGIGLEFALADEEVVESLKSMVRTLSTRSIGQSS